MTEHAAPAGRREVLNFINGRYERSRDGKTFAGVSPATGAQATAAPPTRQTSNFFGSTAQPGFGLPMELVCEALVDGAAGVTA